MFVVPLSCLSICRSDKFIFPPATSSQATPPSREVNGKKLKSQLLLLTHQILKHKETDGITTPGLGAGAQHPHRVQSSPCSSTNQPKD